MNYKVTKIICAISCLFTILVVAVVMYEYVLIKQMGESATVLESELMAEKQSIESFSALAKTATNIKADSEKANIFFIKRDDVVTFLDELESLSSTTKAHVSVQVVNEKKTSVNQPLLSVVVRVEGSYSDVYYTLRMLEELPYQTEIQNVKLTRDPVSNQKTSNVPQWSAEVNLVGVMF